VLEGKRSKAGENFRKEKEEGARVTLEGGERTKKEEIKRSTASLNQKEESAWKTCKV